MHVFQESSVKLFYDPVLCWGVRCCCFHNDPMASTKISKWFVNVFPAVVRSGFFDFVTALGFNELLECCEVFKHSIFGVPKIDNQILGPGISK